LEIKEDQRFGVGSLSCEACEFGAVREYCIPWRLTENVDKIDKKSVFCPICQCFRQKTLTELTFSLDFVRFVNFEDKIRCF